jgi:putative transposase
MYVVEYRSNNNVVYSCKYHVVWCPKYRRQVLVKPVDTRLKSIIRATATERRCELIELEIMPDHVHLLVEVDPQYGVHRLIKELKRRSSHALRKEFPSLATRLPTLWTNSYFVSTVGGSPLAVVKQYIENQKRSER